MAELVDYWLEPETSPSLTRSERDDRGTAALLIPAPPASDGAANTDANANTNASRQQRVPWWKVFTNEQDRARERERGTMAEEEQNGEGRQLSEFERDVENGDGNTRARFVAVRAHNALDPTLSAKLVDHQIQGRTHFQTFGSN